MTDQGTVDYSEWLTPDRLGVEEKTWEEHKYYELYAAHIRGLVDGARVRTILEVGCGTGWVPTVLPRNVEYRGVDANERCIALAKAKTHHPFVVADIRTYPRQAVDLVCSFAVLKHFALAEWSAVVGNVLQHGRRGLFSIPVAEEDKDDFTAGFPHTFVCHATLDAAVRAAGHDLVFIDPIAKGDEMMIGTKERKEAP